MEYLWWVYSNASGANAVAVVDRNAKNLNINWLPDCCMISGETRVSFYNQSKACIVGNVLMELKNVLAYESFDLLLDSYPVACPLSGEFIGYKKVGVEIADSVIIDAVATLLIPADAQRTSSIGRKCRCDKAKVLRIVDAIEGKEHTTACSTCYQNSATHVVGEMAYPDSYDPDRRKECTNGIHFFMSEQDAWQYE